MGRATYGSLRLLPGVWGSVYQHIETNQSLRSPRQGSGGILWTVEGPHFWASRWTSMLSDAPPPTAQGEGMTGSLVKEEMEEDLELDAVDEAME